MRRFLHVLAEVVTDAGFGLFFGYLTWHPTHSVFAAALSTIVGSFLAVMAWRIIDFRLRFSSHFPFLKDLNDRLSPPKLCPVVLNETKQAILDAIQERRAEAVLLREGERILTWKRYGELLTSSFGW